MSLSSTTFSFCWLIFILLLSLCSSSINATISPAFSSFLIQKFGGSETEEMLARRDMGAVGSFGGGNHSAGQKTRKRPVVMVHGLTMFAGQLEGVQLYFLMQGYSREEVYATTYSFGSKRSATDSMECAHVKRIRVLIQAVAKFTNSQVDVIGYSMGSPIGRKAILGGNCVDSGEHIGPPLTRLVHTFIGVAGANRDAVYLCRALGKRGPCNNVTGISCHSLFLDDLNYRNGKRYEASSHIYIIYSRADNIVGYLDCDQQKVSSIPGQDDAIEFLLYDHFATIFGTSKEQLELLIGIGNRNDLLLKLLTSQSSLAEK